MYLVLFILMIICLLIGYSFGQNNASNYDYGNNMSNKEYEFRFISLVSQIDSSKNIAWIGQALDLLKADYKHYHENPRAMSTLDLLEEAVNEDNSMISNFIKSCGRMTI